MEREEGEYDIFLDGEYFCKGTIDFLDGTLGREIDISLPKVQKIDFQEIMRGKKAFYLAGEPTAKYFETRCVLLRAQLRSIKLDLNSLSEDNERLRSEIVALSGGKRSTRRTGDKWINTSQLLVEDRLLARKETCKGRPVASFIRTVMQNIRKVIFKS